MEGVQIPIQPSLDRLKALDSLPDLPSQLAEATRLCTHGARADMIAKWLLEKLKSSQEIRSNVEAWRSLYSTIRLLSPERLATMLSSHNFLKTLSSALEETQSSAILLHALNDIFSFLLEVSETSNGAPVRAVLSTSVSQAASFLGLWFQNMHQRTHSVKDFVSSQDNFSLLRPALHIWNLRKPSTEENELFAKHCLVPASSLLSFLSSEKHVTTLKRKRHDEDGNSKEGCTKELETLLARHMFLPARTAFYKAQDFTASKGQRQVGSQHPTFVIETILQPLKTAVAQGDEEGEAHLGALPLLLDIALRCVATPTPRQRTKEKPWIEAVFEALHECNRNPAEGVRSRSVLVKMLQVIGARASLSKGTLENIVRLYSILSLSPNEEENRGVGSLEHWTLIAQVIKLDADMFTDPKMAEPLFTRITKASIKVGGLAANEKFIPSQNLISSWQTLWLERIVIPIMKAFGRNRNLMTFVDLWSQQLEQDLHDQVWSVWAELGEHFQSILEDSIIESEILELFDRLSKPIADAFTGMDTGEAPTVPLNIGPNIVILDGILGGLHTESLVNKIAVKCEALLSDLIKLFDKRADTLGSDVSSSPYKKRIWALMTKAFEFWFPTWTFERSDASVIAERCSWLISRFALQAVLSIAKAMRSEKEATATPTGDASDAECFVAGLCHRVSAYKESLEPEIRNDLAEILDSLFQQLDPNHSQAISLCPDLMLLIQNSQTRRDFLTRCITAAAATTSDDDHSSASLMTGLRSLVAAGVISVRTEVVEDVVRVAADLLGGMQEHYDEDIGQALNRKESVAIDLLSQIPVTCLTRAQRENILDTLSTTKGINNYPQQETLQSRLALMMKLMEMPNATSKLSTDNTAIWRMALGVSAVEYVNTGIDAPPQTEELKTIALLEELARLIVKHLLTTQDQERSQSTLLDLSTDVKVVLEFVCNSGKIRDKVTALAMSSTILQELEGGAKQALKQQLPHRNAQKMKELCSMLLSATTETISMSMDPDSGPLESAMVIAFNIIVDTLSTIAELFVEAADVETRDFIGKVTKVNLKHMDMSWSVDALRKAEPTAYQAALVRSFKICCKHVPFGDDWPLADVALHLLDMQLPPADIETLIDSFKERVEKLDGASLVCLIEELLPVDKEVHQPHLLLLQSCLAMLGKDDIPPTAGSVRYQLPLRLLRTATESDDLLKRQRATSCILIALKEKPFLNNQHTVDETLASLPRLLEGRLAASIAYLDVCQIISALLLNHRARLQGRFHLVKNVYQVLISKLFRDPKESLPYRILGEQLAPKHAHALARALTLFCEPLLLRQKSNSSGLTDESRKEQAHVGQYVQYVLHHYCSQVLNGSLGNGMKEALTSGLWAMIEAIEMNDADGMKSLSASMNNSERAVLRGVYDDWKRFGKWRGG